MLQGWLEGSATLEDAIAAHDPSVRARRDQTGLTKNLRERYDRWFWHWHPQFIDEDPALEPARADSYERAIRAAWCVSVPTVLVRGSASRIVNKYSADELLLTIPGSEFVDVSGAGHMVAGDSNAVSFAPLEVFIEQRAHGRGQASVFG